MRTLLNVALFQTGWFACVLGAAAGRAWIGAAVVAVVLAAHLLGPGRRSEIVVVVVSALFGLLADSALRASGLVRYAAAGIGPAWLAPLWIVAMWANFAITLDHSLAWLSGRPWLAAALGAACGPLAYAAGARFGAIELETGALAALALVWAVAVPSLCALSSSLRPRATIP